MSKCQKDIRDLQKVVPKSMNVMVDVLVATCCFVLFQHVSIVCTQGFYKSRIVHVFILHLGFCTSCIQ